MPCSSYTLTLRPSFPKIVHPEKSSYFKVLYTCYFASSITPGFSGHMIPLVLILQSLINNKDNFEQHLRLIKPSYMSEHTALTVFRILVGIREKNALTVSFLRSLSTARIRVSFPTRIVTIVTKSLCPFFKAISSIPITHNRCMAFQLTSVLI